MILNPFFSVIIPIYNKEPYVKRAINSILNQSFKNYEIIIVCDPSTDNSNLEVEKFSNLTNLSILYRKERGPGGYASRNLGIRNSKSNWIAFLDADDEWYPNHLQKTYDLIKSYSNANFVTSAWHLKFGDKLLLDPFSNKEKHTNALFLTFEDYLYNSLKSYRPNNTNSVVFKKSLISDSGFFPEGKTNRSGDLYAWVINIQKAGGIYRSPHIGSVTYRDSLNMTSKTEIPSIELNHYMVKEVSIRASKKEQFLIKKYANRLIKRAFFESKKFNVQLTESLIKSFYWSNDFSFCLFWSFISFFPNELINFLRKAKSNLKT